MDEHSREALYAARRQIRKILSENGKRVNLGRLPFIPDEVSELTGLVEFVISGPDISDLTPIRKQNGLHSLSIAGTGVADLEAIESFPELTHLKLDSTEIVDLTPIANLRKLKVLSFGQTKVTDLSPLAELSELEELYFANTGATDLSPLSGSKKLSRLYLNDTAVTDLSPLIGLKRIKTLNLSNTRVEDLRPVLDIGVFTTKPEGLFFERTPITRKDDELNYLSKLMDSHELVKDVIAHLKTLPPWPEPLPWLEEKAPQKAKAPEKPDKPFVPPKGLRLITMAEARQVLEQRHPILRDRCQAVVAQIDDSLGFLAVRIPNDPALLEEHQTLVDSLTYAKAAMASLHDALPAEMTDQPITEADASRLKAGFEATLAKLKEAAAYIDQKDHTPTYGGLMKLGAATAVGGVLALFPGIGMAAAIPVVFACLYGPAAAKAIKDMGKLE